MLLLIFGSLFSLVAWCRSFFTKHPQEWEFFSDRFLYPLVVIACLIAAWQSFWGRSTWQHYLASSKHDETQGDNWIGYVIMFFVLLGAAWWIIELVKRLIPDEE